MSASDALSTGQSGIPAVGTVSRHLVVVMLFGAARQDGSLEQVQRLRNEALPLMRDTKMPLKAVAEKVLEVMGPQWAPSGEWMRAIEQLADTSGQSTGG